MPIDLAKRIEKHLKSERRGRIAILEHKSEHTSDVRDVEIEIVVV